MTTTSGSASSVTWLNSMRTGSNAESAAGSNAVAAVLLVAGRQRGLKQAPEALGLGVGPSRRDPGDPAP